MSAKWLSIFAVVSLLLISSVACADMDEDVDPLQLTTDQTKIIHLKQDAASVIVDNPGHVGVTLDNPRLLIVTPYEPGVTSMTALDSTGKIILQQDIIVTNVQPNYVRIRRMCSGTDSSCTATSYAYCPDGCYELTTVPADGNAGSAPPPPASPGLIGGEPAETLLGPADDCPEGYNKVFVPGIKSGDQHYTCAKR